MSNKYPRFQSAKKHLNRKEQCDACTSQQEFIVWVEFGYMRGTDDEDYQACSRHKKIASKSINQFLAHVKTKDKYFASLTKEAS